MKLYLRINPNTNETVTSKHVIEYRNALEWGELKDATLDDRLPAEATQKQLSEIGVQTELEEVRRPNGMESKWAISKDS